MLTDFYNIWHGVYWNNKQHKNYWVAHLTYWRCCTTFEKINYFWAFQTFSPVVYAWFLNELAFLVMRWEYRLGSWKWTLITDAGSKHHLKSRRQLKLHLLSRWHPSSHGECRSSGLSWVYSWESLAPNSPDLNPRDYHEWGAMLEKYYKLHLKPKAIDELKVALETIWEELP